jgi:hypothetical protein
MNIGKMVRAAMISMATVGVCLPQLCFAAPPPPPAPAVADIALADGGTLHGRVVDLQGAARVGVDVSIRAQDREVARAKSTAEGQFSVQGLRGGVYQVAAGQGQGVYRLWATNTAPPSAQKDVIVYTQCCPDQCQPQCQPCPGQGCDPCCEKPGVLKCLLTNPIIIAGVVATAIAVPVALANSHHASP